MSTRHRMSRLTRFWRSRRMVWRAALLFVTLILLSLLGVLWSLLADSTGEQPRLDDQHRQGREAVVPPPPPPHYEDAEENADGKIPFRRPTSTTTDSPSLTPSNVLTPPAPFTPWFNAAADNAGGLSNTSSPLFQSSGVARVVLLPATDPVTGAVVPQPPRLLATNVSWAAYNRFVQSAGKRGQQDGETNTEAQDPAKLSLRPLQQVEVQLLRQRRSRSVWADGADAAEVIVGVIPAESSILSSADELLVEHHLRAEDIPNADPDPDRLVPVTATALAPQRGGKGTSDVSLRIDVAAAAAAARGSKGAATGTPLVELKTVRRSASVAALHPVSTTTTEVAPAATSLTWRADSAGEANPVTVEMVLDVVHPRRSVAAAAGVAADGNAGADQVYTEALQATICSSRIVRLYGVAPHRLGPQTEEAAATVDESSWPTDGIDSIPLNLSEDVELMVGGQQSSPAGAARMAGVVPLLYMDLDTSYAAQPSPSTTSRRTVGLLWLHPAPLRLSTATASGRVCVRLRSTAGATKLYLLPGPTPADVLRQYYTLTGFPTLPPRFALGYHYGIHSAAAATEQAVEALSAAFRNARLPLDTVWATHTAVAARDTPFTWNTTRVPDPLRLQSNLWYSGRRYVVTRTVPTVPITTRSPLFLEGRREGFFVTLTAEESAGWPTYSVDGVPSHVVDFTNAAARRWYGNMLKYRRYVGSTNHTFIALQHSTPAVWAAEAENTQIAACTRTALARDGDLLPMEVGHRGGFSHREVHQLLPVGFARATHEGMLRRTQYVRRALVLTESYYAGMQRYAVVQVEARPACTPATADVLRSAWEQLHAAVRQCAQLSLLGLPFSGANLGAGLTDGLRRLLHDAPAAAGVRGVEMLAGEEEGEALAKGEGNERRPHDNATSTTQMGTHDGDIILNGTVPSSTLAKVESSSTTRAEAEQLLVRWHQAGVFFPFMYTLENNLESWARPAAPTQNGRDGFAAGPWWVRLSVENATRAAIEANVKVRYALLPYLYTTAFEASESGHIFLAPISFSPVSTASRVLAPFQPDRTGGIADSAAASTCYAVGRALVVCPVTDRRVHGRAGSTARGEALSLVKDGTSAAGLFNLWTGAWSSAVRAPPRHAAVSWMEVSGGDQPRAKAGLPSSDMLAHAFLRPGHILATQNVLQTVDSESSDVDALDDAQATHSTHMGANWTLTIALPKLPMATETQPGARVLLAEGSVFWDEGSHNTQQRPPAPTAGASPLPIPHPIIPHHVHHCQLHLQCFYVTATNADDDTDTNTNTNRNAVRNAGSGAQLRLEVSQASPTCAEALAELQAHWAEEPEGFAERLALAKERRAIRQHARDVEQNEREDKGLRAGRRETAAGQPTMQRFHDDDLNGLLLPSAAEAVRHDLWRSHLLHRVRFLFQHEEDAAQFVTFSTAEDALRSSVTVQRRSVVRETEGDDNVTGRVEVSRCAPDSAAVMVDFTACSTCAGGAADALAATSLFGVTKMSGDGGESVSRIPRVHTWRFTFPLRNA